MTTSCFDRCVAAVFIAALGVAHAPALFAQAWPAKPVRLIIPAGTGGGVDTIARLIGPPLAVALGQPVVADNRPGAGTALASEITAGAPGDGYTLLMMTNSHTINASLRKKLRYDPVNDFTPICQVARLPYLLVIHPSVPARTPKELIALAKRRPGDLHFSSAGTGSGTHLAFELFVAMAKINAVHVPFKSGTAALIDLNGGHVQMMMSNVINSMPHVKAKRLVALGISTLKPSPLYPDLPTIAGSGLPGYESDAWYGLMGPARMPPEIVARLNREVLAIIRGGEVRAKLASQGAEVTGSTPEEFAALIRRDIAKWAKVTAALKLQLD